MSLSQRLLVMLLPTILLVVFSAAWFTYLGLAQLTRTSLQSGLEQEVGFLVRQMKEEVKYSHSALARFLSSAQSIRYLNALDYDELNTDEFTRYTHEMDLHRIAGRLQRSQPNISLIAITTKALQTKLVVGGQDPFSGLTVPNWLKKHLLNTQSAVANSPSGMNLLYRDNNGEIKFALARAVSSHLLLGDTSIANDPDYFFGIIIADVTSIKDTLPKLKQRYEQLSIDISVSSDASFDTSEAKITSHWRDATLVIKIEHALMQAKIELETAKVSAITDLQQQVALSALALALLTFLLISLIIQKQVLAPIQGVLADINSSKTSETLSLRYKNSRNEVAQLNNGYLELFDLLYEQAETDSLTGLSNRQSFHQQLQRHIARASQEGSTSALLYIDLDNFKRVNDHYGHNEGDRLLQLFAAKLVNTVRPNDTVVKRDQRHVSRLAGDEFAVILNNLRSPEIAAKVAQRILDILKNGIEVNGHNHPVHASIGIALIPQDGESLESILNHADAAMYQAKKRGRNRFQLFNEDIARAMRERAMIEDTLELSLQEQTFQLVYQPVIDADTLQTVGFEVLIRCPALQSKGIGPDRFIPIAESCGLIKRIDMWVLERAISKLEQLQTRHQFNGSIAVNVSAMELQNDQFPQQLKALFGKYHVQAKYLELEITETSLVDINEKTLLALNKLKALGLRLSLDDFGTGYTAFNQLMSFPVDILKIDRSFVQAIGEATDNSMIDIIFTLIEHYQLEVIAEGIETELQANYLRQLGCKKMQGYLFSQPLPENAIEAWLENHFKRLEA
ncbi:putative bifunctional diguanylate cyclase/phosphodiesterase [Agarivorans aestuarii]|uniref:putative bifunctional diguanylate cyclase/phosphodiesterase n=1 Tax=Agarivorans aestuarii TaxID=1563703 RepID=UPI001C8143C8|nr:EAL domain-containing protein [Agarivorans aestuarii]